MDTRELISYISQGLLGRGTWILVGSKESVRFTKALPLGNGDFPNGPVIREEDLNKPQEGEYEGEDGYFVVEVPIPGDEEYPEVPDWKERMYLYKSAVSAGFYKGVVRKAMELRHLEDVLYMLRDKFLEDVLWVERDLGESYTHVTGTCCSDTGIVLIKWESTNRWERIKGSQVCDGHVYPYLTEVSILEDGTIHTSRPPFREMTEEEWEELRRGGYKDVKHGPVNEQGDGVGMFVRKANGGTDG